MTASKLVNILALFLVVALVSAILTLRARSEAEWRALVAEVAGEDVITFRSKQGEVFLGSWTPEHFADLQELEGVRDLFWRGGYLLSQGPASRYVLPVTTASPGFLSAQRSSFLAGRDLSEEDAGLPRVVLSEEHARTIFPDEALEDIIGQRVQVQRERLMVVGVVDEADAAYRAATTPEGPDSRGRYGVQSVYLRLSEQADMARVTAQVNRYLAGTEELSVLEAVPYREFVRPGVANERLDYVREVTTLFGWLVGFALLLAVVNLLNQALLAAAEKRRGWALHRVLGASRARLIGRELLGGLKLEWLAIALGLLAGLLLGHGLGGLVSLQVIVLGLAVGTLSLLLGSLPLVWEVLRLYPYRALRQSQGLLRHPLLNLTGALGLAVGLALVVIAGGFRDLGQRAIGGEIAAVGADLVVFVPDRSSILPAARLTEGDLAALKRAYPELPVTLSERHLGEARAGEVAQEVSVYAADESFLAVSGTRLAAGSWQDGGLVLGSAVAEALFPEGDALGETLTLSGTRIGRLEAPVAAVAQPPSTERLETLQLAENAVLLSRELLLASALRSELHARIGSLDESELEAVSAFLSERHPEAAPFTARYAAASYQGFLERLEEQLRQFNLVALLIFALAAVGLSTLATMRALGRRYLRGLERAFGARRADVFRSEFWSALRLTLLVGGFGVAAGLAGLWLWTRAQDYAFVLPLAWLAAALATALLIGLPVGLAVARRSAAQPPVAVLRGDL